jgi:membrane protease subunit (stomatin/prohibitin family)
MAVFVNEGKVADVFGPGMYKLTTQTIPVLTYLKNWDKLFESPFKSEVYFFSTRQQVDQKWGTLAAGDHPRQGLRRRCAFAPLAITAFASPIPSCSTPKFPGTRESYGTADLDGQLRGLVLQHLSDAIAQSGIPFLDLAANQIEFAKALSPPSCRRPLRPSA